MQQLIDAANAVSQELDREFLTPAQIEALTDVFIKLETQLTELTGGTDWHDLVRCPERVLKYPTHH